MQRPSSEPLDTALPFSVPLLTIPGASDSVRVWSSEWVGLVCSSHPSLTLGFSASTAGRLGPGSLLLLGVSLPPAGLLVPPWLPALLTGADSQILAEAGLEVGPGPVAGAPLVSGCPLRFECRNGVLSARSGTVLLSAEIAAVHLPDETIGPERWAELARLRPLERVFPRGNES
ncbi:hypothetical protein JCM30471_18780 [Desulfuromonas carbonis]|uniref:hypothetical protein n=1 Tax=Desulfuromonas sp. DDH964 TaxID=1823759 RepID=UPI00078E1912|nr:hypothetical protein [Desulfuromonas sp. DDH964]AMV73462.1 hypothetical protein DBW_3155 [Desulfuromonas sp. DDH964]